MPESAVYMTNAAYRIQREEVIISDLKVLKFLQKKFLG